MSSSYELIMPFLPVQSRGGPYNDDAYAAGFEMGALDAKLSLYGFPYPNLEVTIHTQNREQADLIAMRYGYVTEVLAPDASGAWLHLKLRRVAQS